jgi:hypothetical protein
MNVQFSFLLERGKNGDMKYLFALMEDETRYLITQVTDTKLIHDASRLCHKGKEVMGKKPATLITDGLYERDLSPSKCHSSWS